MDIPLPPKPAIFVPATPAIHVRGEPQIAWHSPMQASVMPMVLLMAAATGGGGHGSAQTAYSISQTTDDSGNENYSYRIQTVSGLALTGTITQVRVRFVASSSASFKADNASIGKQSSTYVTTATPVELKFSGASGFTIPAGNTLTSDWMDVPSLFSNGDIAVVIVDFSSTLANNRYGSSGASHFQANADSYASASPGGSWTSSSLKRCFDLIEART